MVIKDKFKVGDKVIVKPWGYKTGLMDKEHLSGQVITIKKVWGTLYPEDGDREQDFFVEENDHLWSNYQVDKINLTKKQRDMKIKKIIKEIENNEEFKSCFKNINEEVNGWDDYKVDKWNLK